MAVVSPDPGSAQSAVVVPVPEAEPVAGRFRAQLDPAATWGVPARVTILYPFVPPDAITSAEIERAAAAVHSVRAFSCEFARTGWFGDDVVWLAPEPAEPFQTMTSAVHAAFPLFPPFGGSYNDVVPHLTIGHRAQGGPGALRAAQAEVRPALPIRTRVNAAWLMTGGTAPGSWRVLAELPLGY